jgi:hypothetical protein
VASARRTSAWARSPSAATLARIVASAAADVVEEGGVHGAARQRLEAERAAAGEGVEHAGADQRRGAVAAEIGMGQPVEQRLAGAVGRRPHRIARRRLDPAALMPAADDAHGCPGPPPRRAPRGAWPAPRRRAARAAPCPAPPRRLPASRWPSWNGPKAIRMRRETGQPRCSQTRRISRFLPSRSPIVEPGVVALLAVEAGARWVRRRRPSTVIAVAERSSRRCSTAPWTRTR